MGAAKGASGGGLLGLLLNTGLSAAPLLVGPSAGGGRSPQQAALNALLLGGVGGDGANPSLAGERSSGPLTGNLATAAGGLPGLAISSIRSGQFPSASDFASALAGSLASKLTGGLTNVLGASSLVAKAFGVPSITNPLQGVPTIEDIASFRTINPTFANTLQSQRDAAIAGLAASSFANLSGQVDPELSAGGFTGTGGFAGGTASDQGSPGPGAGDPGGSGGMNE